MIPIDNLLPRLEKVRRTGSGTWLACCPAHDDRHPSMTVRELEDGRLLLHCFTGCDVGQIVGAVGLELSDLFPPRALGDCVQPVRRPFPAADVLEALAGEMLAAWVVSRDIEAGLTPSQDDLQRLTVANARIQAALEVIGGR